ncbi:hypothetical protein FQA39_LY19300 [Lamprigera yunnana]|nr:hypothetical protein FQA39_LY19300 [Lamprigera yunnana]
MVALGFRPGATKPCWTAGTAAMFEDLALSAEPRAADPHREVAAKPQEGGDRSVIAKIEKPQAVEHLEEIVAAFDGIMVARGDLGVELPLERVPLVQTEAITIARRNAKPRDTVATQVFESMIENPRPTRAEASDCANAVLDGADAVMLSGETSVGGTPCRRGHDGEDYGVDRGSMRSDRIDQLDLAAHPGWRAHPRSMPKFADFIGGPRLSACSTESGDTVATDVAACVPDPDHRL